MSVEESFASEELLVEHCLAGDQAAWWSLYHHYQPGLLESLFRMLNPGARSADLVEELAARVWYSLVLQDGRRLRKYTSRRGCLGTYLAALAHQEVQRYYRPRTQSGVREVPLPPTLMARPQAVLSLATLDGFSATLTRQEQRFFDEHLLGLPTNPALSSLSPAYLRKLKQRVLLKLHAFLHGT